MPAFSLAEDHQTIYISQFYGSGCPHCEKEKEFLIDLQNDFPNIEIKYFEIYKNKENAKLLQNIAKKLEVKEYGVPFLLVGDEAVVGYLNDKTTGAKIKNIIEEHQITGCYDFVGEVKKGDGAGKDVCKMDEEAHVINLPLLGEVNTKTFSLPLLTIVIAALDGFNPCAMWVLLFLISLLLGMKDRKKMWILGTSFIVTSALVYFLFLSAWLNLFLFIGVIATVRIVIGLVAIASGGYHLKEWHTNKSGACKVTNPGQKQKIMDKFREIAEQKSFWLALSGINVLAFAVNLIELVCSAGLPAIYTQILVLADLSPLKYYLYLLLYILIFLLDDLLIFVIAMTTLKSVGLNGKYSSYSNLIGGIVILILGILLILKPEWVMFG